MNEPSSFDRTIVNKNVLSGTFFNAIKRRRIKMKYAVFNSLKSGRPALTGRESIREEDVIFGFEADNLEKAIAIAESKFEFNDNKKLIPVLIIEYLEEPYYTYIDPSLKSLQQLVGGNIEITSCCDCCGADIVCNEEGKIMKLPLNRGLFENEILYDIIAGTMVITSTDSEGNTTGISKLVAKKVYEYFYRPELFHFDVEKQIVSSIKCSLDTAKIMKINNIFMIS